MSSRGATLLYVIALVAGGLGGCAAASQHMLRHDSGKLWLYFFAYGVLGMFFGLGSYAAQATIGSPYLTPEETTFFSLLYGFSGAIALAATNVSLKFILKRLGIEVNVTVNRKDKDAS